MHVYIQNMAKAVDWRHWSACVVSHIEPLESVCRGEMWRNGRWFVSSYPSLANKERHHCLKRHQEPNRDASSSFSSLYILLYFVHGCQSNKIEKIWEEIEVKKWRPDSSSMLKMSKSAFWWLRMKRVLNWEKWVCVGEYLVGYDINNF